MGNGRRTGDPSTARLRALARMSRLLGTAALGAAAYANQVACTGDKDKPPSRGDQGYGVVDPAPSPAPCARLVKLFRASARFEASDAGPGSIVFSIDAPTSSEAELVKPVNEKEGDTSRTLTPRGLEIRIPVTQNADSMTARFDIKCAEGPSYMEVSTSWDRATPIDAQPLAARVSEGYYGFH